VVPPLAYKKDMTKREELIKNFDLIIKDISINNLSTRKSVKKWMSPTTFYKLINEDEKKMEQYVRAVEIRADNLFDELLDIADNVGQDIIIDGDGKEITNHAVINRDRLRVDARKWALSKMNPKKYGDRLLTDNKNTNENTIIWKEEKTYEAKPKADESN
jgi:hypothetical protein